MTDLEMTRLCAEAMGFSHSKWSEFTPPVTGTGIAAKIANQKPWFDYDPLHNDAQAMELVKRLTLNINYDNGVTVSKHGFEAWDKDRNLNRAVVECVAHLQAAKEAK